MDAEGLLPRRLAGCTVPLGSIAESMTAGITLGPDRKPRKRPAGYLRVANVRRSAFDMADIATVELYPQDRPRYELTSGDILLVEGHADPAEIGRCALVESEQAGLLYQNHLFRIRFHNVVPEFAAIWLNSPYVRSYWRTHCATSSGLYTINSKLLGRLPFPILPEGEQRWIVAAHTAFGRQIGALEAVLGKLRVTEQALSTKALTPAQFNEWDQVPLESVATVSAGVTLGSEPVGDGTVELPYLRVANVLDGRIDTADMKRVRILSTQYERYALKQGDLLLTEGGDLDKLGRGAVWDGRIEHCLHQNHVFRVRCRQRMTPDFLALYTASTAGRAYFQRVGKQTTNLASINSTQVKKMPVPVPLLEEQERLLGPIRAARKRAEVLEKQIAKLRTVQQGVVEDLLTGHTKAYAV